MKTYSKDEVLEMASTVEDLTLDAGDILNVSAEMLRAFAQTLGEPVTYSVTPLSDVVLLRSLIEDVENMHPTVRSQLAHLATRIERGVAIGSTRCRKCGEAAEVSIHSAVLGGEPVAVPDGHQIVPLLPTADMLDAAADAFIGFSGEDEVDAVWKAMLSASPHHPTTEK